MKNEMMPLLYGRTTDAVVYPGGKTWFEVEESITLTRMRECLDNGSEVFAVMQEDERTTGFTVDSFAPIGCIARITAITSPRGEEYHSGTAMVELRGICRGRLKEVEQRADRVFGTVERIPNMESDLTDDVCLNALRALDQAAYDLVELRKELRCYKYIDACIEKEQMEYRRGEIDFPIGTLAKYAISDPTELKKMLECEDAAQIAQQITAACNETISNELLDMLRSIEGIYRRYNSAERVDPEHGNTLSSIQKNVIKYLQEKCDKLKKARENSIDPELN